MIVALALIFQILLLTATVSPLFGETTVNPPTQWIKDIGSFGLGIGNSLIQSADGGYALTGGKEGGFLLVKTNLSGDVEWKKTYGTGAEFTSFASAVVQADDGGYVIAGQGTPWPNFVGPNGTLFNLLKTDQDGNVEWNKTYSTETTPFIATSLIKTDDGGYAVAGYAETGHSIMSSGTGYVCLIKTDKAGNIEWKKQIIADPIWAPIHISVHETDDSGFALLTVVDYTENTLPVVTNVDFWLIKTDSDGDIQWSENYGGEYSDLPSCFIETSDGGYLLGGNTLKNRIVDSMTYFQQDSLLIKTNSEGQMLWNKTYGGEGPDSIVSVLEAKEGGYVVANSIDLSSENLPSGASIFKTDTFGNTEWTVEYQGTTQPSFYPLKILETAEDSYVFTGYTRLDIESMSIVLVKLTEPIAVSNNYWTTKEPLPDSCSGVAVVDEKIYAIGSGTNNEYDPTADSWMAKTPMPIPQYHFGIAVYQNKIYVIGGTSNNTETGLNQVYDPATDSWETRASMPTPRSQLEANVVNNKIYLIGGMTGGPDSTVGLNEVYDPDTDLWSSEAAIPVPVDSYASAVVDDKIYVIGGSGPKPPNVNQIYDPKTNSWSNGSPIPQGVVDAAAGATSGGFASKRIYVLGGRINYEMWGSEINQIYNPENDSWTTGKPMPIGRYNLKVAVINDKIYAMGGVPYFNHQGTWTPENYQYTPIGYIPEFPSWIILPLFLMATLAVIELRKKLKKSI